MLTGLVCQKAFCLLSKIMTGTMAPMEGANKVVKTYVRLLLLPFWPTNVAWAIVLTYGYSRDVLTRGFCHLPPYSTTNPTHPSVSYTYQH